MGIQNVEKTLLLFILRNQLRHYGGGFGSKGGSKQIQVSALLPIPVIFTQFLTGLHLFHAVGENVNNFFFRVASLAFETNVLAELEKSGSRQIGDVVSEYPNQSLAVITKTITFVP